MTTRKKDLKPDRCIGLAKSEIAVENWQLLHSGIACITDDIHETKKNTETDPQWYF